MTGERILIVDDDVITRLTLNETLQSGGYFVTTCESGEKAISIIERNQFDLVVLDLKMPGMNGLDLLKIMHEKHPELRVIMLTAHGSMDSAIEALRYKAYDFLLKPSQPSEILDTVRRVIQEPRHELNITKGSQLFSDRTEYILPGGNKIDWKRRFARGVNGQTMPLTPTEIRILEILTDNNHQAISHQRLVLEAQGYQMDDEEAAKLLRPVMSRLRHKLEFVFHDVDWLKTIRGFGYKVELS